MSLALIVLGIVTAVELLIWLPPLWKIKKVLIVGIVPVLSLTSGLVFGWDIAAWSGLLLIFSVYRLINLLRILDGRMSSKHLYVASRRTAWWLIGCQLFVLGGLWLSRELQISAMAWSYVMAGVQLAAAALLWLSTTRTLRTTLPPTQIKSLADKELPTLSIAIPARNETEDLEECLQSLISSDYPKLEILVLDDCSQNKRTPGIIRDFAQSGVRFIAGEVPPEHWLAKNYAYAQLAEEANGELLLFCGVDTRFKPGTLRAMVEAMKAKHKTMVSFVPRNRLPSSLHIESLLVQPARYAWEIAPPRRQLERPPVLSTCWVITAKELKRAGGFEAVSRSISPESYFAKSAAKHGDGYSFMRAEAAIDLDSAKILTEQRATAVRTRYPQLHRRPELVAFSGIGELLVLIAPFGLLIGAILDHRWPLLTLSLAAALLLISFYARAVQLAYRRFLWRGLWTLPLAAIYDIGLLNYSMWQYEFREVIWKGRNVCVPVMRHIESAETLSAGSGKTP
ncbi:MAG TPA: glycosyltransferase [Candidatus Saccharimonadales bacterium]|nr:glycosyltransferase [Candidatus Saccharimonadales bacterium]